MLTVSVERRAQVFTNLEVQSWYKKALEIIIESSGRVSKQLVESVGENTANGATTETTDFGAQLDRLSEMDYSKINLEEV